jgi:hypothetical protein
MAVEHDVYALAEELWPEAIVFNLQRPPGKEYAGDIVAEGYTITAANATGGVVDQCSGITIDELYANLNRRLGGMSNT